MKKNIILLSGLIIASMTPIATAAEVVIKQKDKKFSQTSVKIKKGDSIVFKNEEKDITHNVFSLGPKNAFELKTQPPGQATNFVFNEVGKTEVECAIHPNMKLVVEVQ